MKALIQHFDSRIINHLTATLCLKWALDDAAALLPLYYTNILLTVFIFDWSISTDNSQLENKCLPLYLDNLWTGHTDWHGKTKSNRIQEGIVIYNSNCAYNIRLIPYEETH